MTSSSLLCEAALCHRKHKPNSPGLPHCLASRGEEKAHGEPTSWGWGWGWLGTFWHPPAPVVPGKDGLSLSKLGHSSAGKFSLRLPCWGDGLHRAFPVYAPLPEGTWRPAPLESILCKCSSSPEMSLDDSVNTVLESVWASSVCLITFICGILKAAGCRGLGSCLVPKACLASLR